MIFFYYLFIFDQLSNNFLLFYYLISLPRQTLKIENENGKLNYLFLNIFLAIFSYILTVFSLNNKM